MIKLANKQLDKLAAFFERVEASFDDGFPTERAEILTFIIACAGATFVFYIIVLMAFILG